MGSFISSLLFQPLLLGTAIALMVIGIHYQGKTCKDADSGNMGVEVFKLNMGLAITIVILAILINFISAFEI